MREEGRGEGGREGEANIQTYIPRSSVRAPPMSGPTTSPAGTHTLLNSEATVSQSVSQ